jgi:hypothetical protein
MLILLSAVAAAQQQTPLALAISAARPDGSAPDEIRIRIELTNVSNKPIRIAATNTPGGSQVDYDIRITRKDRRTVARTSYGASLVGEGNQPVSNSARLVTLQPGVTRSESFLLNRVFDVGRPGIYRLQIQRHATAGTRLRPISNVLEIAVE